MKSLDPIATYAAIVATGSLLWNLSRGRRRLVIEMVHGFDPHGSDELGAVGLLLNRSALPVVVRHVGLAYRARPATLWYRIKLALRYGRITGVGWIGISLPDAPGPMTIHPGDNGMVFVSPVGLSELYRTAGPRGEVRIVAQDALLRSFRSRPMRLSDLVPASA